MGGPRRRLPRRRDRPLHVPGRRPGRSAAQVLVLADDDFVELYNNTGSPITVADGSGINDATHGYGVYKTGSACTDTPILVGIVPNGVVIPPRGHYLLTGTGYSLQNYGGANAALGNATLSATAASPNLEADRNVAVFSTADVSAVSSANRLDAVGFTPGTATDATGGDGHPFIGEVEPGPHPGRRRGRRHHQDDRGDAAR